MIIPWPARWAWFSLRSPVRCLGRLISPAKFQVRWAKPHAFKVRWAHPHQPPVSGLGRILQEERAPLELLKMASVESGFEASALSPKGARGIWQLMPDTARRFGLTVDSFRDDRTD